MTADASAGTAVADARFDFGGNWRRFLDVLDEPRIVAAQESLTELVGDVAGKSFVDVGSGSGLASLAAIRLGARRVHSFDYDRGSVACTAEVKRRYAADAQQWTVEHGDALDTRYLGRLGRFDVVYSWGVLHHTGQMWHALDNVTALVEPEGLLALALYRDEGFESRMWLRVKRAYNRGRLGKAAVVGTFVPAFVLRSAFRDAARRRNPLATYSEYERQRGMSMFRDWLDWLGGLPFEVTSEENVVSFFRERGLECVRVNEGGGSVRNSEYVFRTLPTPY